MAISIKNRDVVNFNAPNATTGKPQADQYLDFNDESGATVASLLVPASGATPSFTVDSEDVVTTQTVRSASIALTNAQIKALPTTSIQIVAAPGVGYVNLPTFGSLRIDTSAGYYDNYDTSCTLAIKYFNSSLYPIGLMLGNSGASGTVPDLLGAQNDAYTIFTPTQVASSTKTLGYTILLADAENKAIELSVANGSPDLGNFTGGNAANTGRVTLEYRKLNLSTGLFE